LNVSNIHDSQHTTTISIVADSKSIISNHTSSIIINQSFDKSMMVLKNSIGANNIDHDDLNYDAEEDFDQYDDDFDA